jgi:hypothetical protein
VEDQSAPIPEEIASELGRIIDRKVARSMRAVKDSLAAPLRAMRRKFESPSPGYGHVPGNRLRSNRKVGLVKNIC